MLTRDEADELFQRERNASFGIYFRLNLPIDGAEDRSFPGTAIVTITREQAHQAACNLLNGFEKRGARLPVTIYSFMILIG